jgi:hypothetical protein
MTGRVGPHRVRSLLQACLLLLLSGAGCGIRGLRRTEVPANMLAAVPTYNTTLKAHLHDGSLVVFRSWKFEQAGHIVTGEARRLDWNRVAGPLARQSVALDSVALFESDELTIPGPMIPITILAALHATVTAIWVLNPKACFGSCPTFYAWDGERQVLMAEGFSASVAPALEATDLDALDRARPRGGQLALTMTNEALETHVLRHADLLLAVRGAGERVLASADGAMWRASDWRAPDVAIGAEGDCRERLATRDRSERTSLADSTDLATRETLELRFDHAPGGPLGLAITARQSLLSTYIFYQTLAWMGRTAGTWLASLGHTDANALARVKSPAALLGGIDVLVERAAGEWTSAGSFKETGPLASDTRLVPLPPVPAGPLRVRLSLTRGLWRVDQVALVSLGERVEPLRVRPVRVLRHGVPDASALACLTAGSDPLVTQPGDTLVLVYELPAAAGDAPEVFLESRGYYLEWMRDSWIAEENAERLARLFLLPAASLREMAPAYKQLEPEMESAFWGSRYAR